MPDWMGKMSVEAEDGKTDSTLELYRRAIKARQSIVSEAGENFAWVQKNKNVLHFKRGEYQVIMNFGKEPIGLPAGQVLLQSAQSGSSGKLEGDCAAWLKAKATS